MSTPEEHVLVARDALVVNENDWEEFGLTDVKIYAQGKPRFANLLAATEENPVRVSGVLDEVEEDQEHLLLDDLYRSKRIHIDKVSHYAFGQHEDGEFGIWVAGKSGWFSITPAKQYKPIYEEVEEAIDLHYFLVDRCSKKGKYKGKKGLSVDDLFEEYVRHTHGRCADAEDSSEIFFKHRVFLLTHMLQDTDKNGLRSSAIFEYLCEAYPDDFEEVQARTGRKADDRASNGETSAFNGTSHASDEQRQADACFETLMNITKSDLVPIRQLNVKTLGRILYERYELKSAAYTEDLIRARAALLLVLMDSTQPSGPSLKKRVIYRELVAAAKLPDRKRVSHSPLRERSPPRPEPSEDEAPDIRKGHNRKSVLRPPRFSSKAAERFGYRKRIRGQETEDEVSMSEQDDTPTQNGHSRQRSSPLVSRPKGLSHLGTSKNENSVLSNHTTVENPSPDLTSNGPDDMWICKYVGCTEMVEKASSKKGTKSIHDHMLTHASESQAKLELVFTEQRYHLPITHLTSYIQEMAGSRSVDGVSAPNSPIPKRVKR